MGCDIHSRAEVRRNGKWEIVGAVFPYDDFGREYHKATHNNEPFDVRHYGMFAFLAGVRNYSMVTPISEPRGIPGDASPEVKAEIKQWDCDAHSRSWLSLADLLAVDYDKTFEDRRTTKQTGPNIWDGAALADAGKGEIVALRDFLGAHFFRDLDVLKTLGQPDDVRVVFWFDN